MFLHHCGFICIPRWLILWLLTKKAMKRKFPIVTFATFIGLLLFALFKVCYKFFLLRAHGTCRTIGLLLFIYFLWMFLRTYGMSDYWTNAIYIFSMNVSYNRATTYMALDCWTTYWPMDYVTHGRYLVFFKAHGSAFYHVWHSPLSY